MMALMDFMLLPFSPADSGQLSHLFC